MEICDAADRGEILPAPNPDALPPPPTNDKQQGKQKKESEKVKEEEAEEVIPSHVVQITYCVS